MYSRSSIYLTIIVAFLASAILSSHYILKYDRLKTSTDDHRGHAMIKIAVGNQWQEADRLLKDIKSGKGYFVSGKEFYDEFLPPRLLALYYYITEINSAKAKKLIDQEIISGGMIPKINNCLDVASNGVKGVVIIDGRKDHSILFELLSDKGSGTLIRE